MTVFTRTWDAAYEALPADSDQISEGAQRIRNTREDVRERIEVDHSLAGDVDDGMHLKVTFVDPLGAKPTQANDETYLYTKDVSATSELFFEDEAGNEVQLTAGGVTETFAAGTTMIFYQNTAPTGWTIVAAVDEHSVTLTKGSAATGIEGGTVGGTADFSTVFAITATDAEAAHTHPVSGNTGTQGSASNTEGGGSQSRTTAHSHSVSITSGAGSSHVHSIDLQVKWAACIMASKD